MQLDDLITQHFSGAKRLSDNHYLTLCPCHDDHKPSLDISKGEKGIVMSCPVCGADGKRVMKAKGLSVSDLFYEQRNNFKEKPKSVDYIYSDVLKKCRFYIPNKGKREFKKCFCWWHKDGKGTWQKGLSKDSTGRSIAPPLYKKNNIELAKQANSVVYVVEGEKDVDTVTNKIGLYAVCSPHGAGTGKLCNKWRSGYNVLFKGVDVAILPDNDEPGRELAEYVATSLLPFAKSVKILDLSREFDLNPKEDITDVYEREKPRNGQTLAEAMKIHLSALLATTEPYVNAQSSKGKEADKPKWAFSERNKPLIIDEEKYIKEFVDKYGVKCVSNQLYSVDGAMSDGKAKQIIIREIMSFIKSNHGDKAEKLLKGIKQFCYTEPPKPSLDKIHFKNGTLSKDSEGLFTVWTEKKEFCINRIEANYNPNAKAPELFNEYLADVYHADDQITLQQYCGYCLLPTTVLQKALIIIGSGGEGKSTIGNILNGIIGSGNCYNESVSVLQNNFGVANVENKLLFIDDDLSEKALESARNFKNLVTNNTVISANKKFVQRNEFKSYVRFICFGNFTLQALYDTSEGFTRRQLVLQAKPKQPGRKDNPFLDKQIVEHESEGVVKWLIDGLNTLIKNNFAIYLSERTKEVSERIKRESDSVTLFLDECDYITVKQGLSIHSTTLHNIYEDFCADNVIVSLRPKTFVENLKVKGIKRGVHYNANVTIRGKRARGFTGIGVSVETEN